MSNSPAFQLSSLRTDLHNQSAKFFRWWLDELIGLVPKSIRDRLRGPRIFIETNGRDVVLTVERYGREKRIVTCAMDDLDGIPKQLKSLSVTERRTATIVLSPGQYLQKAINLPTAARGHVNEAVKYQINRITPFCVNEVYYGARALGDLDGDKEMRVEIAIVPKRDVVALQAFVDRGGVLANRIVCRSPIGERSPFVIQLSDDGSRRRPFLLDGALAMLAIVLASMAGYFAYSHSVSVNELLISKIKTLKPGAEKASALLAEGDSAANFARQIVAAKRQNPNQVAILDKLSAQLSDDVRIIEYRSTEHTVSLTGFAINASGLLAQIDGINGFVGAKFIAAISRDEALQLDHFSLSFDIRDVP